MAWGCFRLACAGLRRIWGNQRGPKNNERTTKSVKNRNFIFAAVLSALVCFSLLLRAQAAPDLALPGFNTADGDHALFSVTTGIANSAFGWYALFADTDGSYNTAVGAGALDLNNGTENTAVGVAALLLNSTGSDNNAFGSTALEFNTTGTFNNAHGRGALFSNVDGFENNAMGDLALFSNTSGGFNTAVGDDALVAVTTGNSNTALGDEAGTNLVDGEGNIYIGTLVNQGGTGVSDGELEIIRIGNDTAFDFPYDTFIAGIFNRAVDVGTAQFVYADDTGKLGTVLVNAAGNKVATPQAMLNESRNQQKRIAELEGTVERLAAMVKEQAAQIQKVSAQLEVIKPAPQVVANKP